MAGPARLFGTPGGVPVSSGADFFSSPDLWIAFLTLFALELALGIDNIVFISILTNRLPESQQKHARMVGLSWPW